jgi:hypothetical protein
VQFGSDHRVRNAFRATLVAVPSSVNLLTALEADADDVLEVTNLDRAIAKAEAVIRERSSRALNAAPESSAIDIFDSIASTDDTAGPAVHMPYIPTPVPPPLPAALRDSDTPTPYALSVALRATRTTNETPRIEIERGLPAATAPAATAPAKARRTAGRTLAWTTGAAVALGLVAAVLGSVVPHSKSLRPASAAIAPSTPLTMHAAEPMTEPTPVMALPREAEPRDLPAIHVRSLKDAPPHRSLPRARTRR